VAHRLDLRFYPVDGHNYVHVGRAEAGGYPRTLALSRQRPQDRWRQEAPALAESFYAVSAERIAMALDDLRSLGPGPTIIAEGPQLFPRLLVGVLRSSRHGLWLLPTAEFGHRGVRERGTNAPEATGQRRLERDALLTERHREQAGALGLPALEIDGTRSLGELADIVTAQLMDLPGGVARAADGQERQRIRQAENAVHARQLHGWWADLGPERMPDAPVFRFTCECELPGCEQLVPLPVTEYERRAAAGPVLAGSN
jgi:hypothetical protein